MGNVKESNKQYFVTLAIVFTNSTMEVQPCKCRLTFKALRRDTVIGPPRNIHYNTLYMCNVLNGNKLESFQSLILYIRIVFFSLKKQVLFSKIRPCNIAFYTICNIAKAGSDQLFYKKFNLNFFDLPSPYLNIYLSNFIKNVTSYIIVCSII